MALRACQKEKRQPLLPPATSSGTYTHPYSGKGQEGAEEDRVGADEEEEH